MGRKKANQESLPGMEARDVPEIEQAAERYRQIRDERCALSKEEAEAKAALIQVMKNKGRQFYSYNGLNVQLSNVENVKVKSKDEDDEDDEDYEPIGRFTQPKRERGAEEIAEDWIEQAEELIEEEQQAADTEEERERLHSEAVATQKADDFTAPRCSECGRIDGAHTKECSKSDALTYENYLAFAQAHYKRNWSSYARKMELRRDPEMDAKVREWQQQQAGNGVEAELEPKTKKSKKLSPVEAAIDR